MWLKNLTRLSSSFFAKDLVVKTTATPKQKPELNEKLLFGTALTDHMLEINWSEPSGWETPEINPYHQFSLDPASSVFHYGTECFEGLKACKTENNGILLFRPEMNMSRLQSSAKSVGLPEFDREQLLLCIKELLKVEDSWIPNKHGYSIYIRPTMIGTHASLGVAKPKNAKLYVIMSTVGPYFPGGFKPIHLYCDDSITRAYPGGSGDKKIGANYAPGIGHTSRLQSKGFNQILWLCNHNVTEAGTMNFFVLWKNLQGETELVTCDLDTTILPGVTRDSIIDIVKNWGEIKVVEKKFTIFELLDAIKDRRVIEIFGTGTACIVCPIAKITFKEEEYKIPMELGSSGVLTKKLLDEIIRIQYGEISHKFQHKVR